MAWLKSNSTCMVFVEWKGEKLLKIEVEEFSYTEDMFNSSIDITLFPNEYHKNITHHINTWSDVRDLRNIVIYYKNKDNVTKYYYLKNGIPNLININTQGFISSCKFKFDHIKEISRPLKISEILSE